MSSRYSPKLALCIYAGVTCVYMAKRDVCVHVYCVCGVCVHGVHIWRACMICVHGVRAMSYMRGVRVSVRVWCTCTVCVRAVRARCMSASCVCRMCVLGVHAMLTCKVCVPSEYGEMCMVLGRVAGCREACQGMDSYSTVGITYDNSEVLRRFTCLIFNEKSLLQQDRL